MKSVVEIYNTTVHEVDSFKKIYCDENQIIRNLLAQEFVSDFPGYGGGLLTEFSWVLRKMDTPLGIALNPGFETGFDMDAEMVADLMASLPAEEK